MATGIRGVGTGAISKEYSRFSVWMDVGVRTESTSQPRVTKIIVLLRETGGRMDISLLEETMVTR